MLSRSLLTAVAAAATSKARTAPFQLTSRCFLRTKNLDSDRKKAAAFVNKGTTKLYRLLLDEYSEAYEKDKEEVDMEMNDITTRIKKHYNIIDSDTGPIVHLKSKNHFEDYMNVAVADRRPLVEVMFNAQNMGEVQPPMNTADKPLLDDNSNFDDLDTVVGVHFVVKITNPYHPVHNNNNNNNNKYVTVGEQVGAKAVANNSLILDCFASEHFRIFKMRELPTTESMLTHCIYDDFLRHKQHIKRGTFSTIKPSTMLYIDSLSPKAQRTWYSYLQSIHVDDDLSFFVLAYGRNKEEQQYLRWLEQMLLMNSPPHQPFVPFSHSFEDVELPEEFK